MKKRIDVDQLPNFDAAVHLADKVALAAVVTDLLREDHGTDLLLFAVADLTRSRGAGDLAVATNMKPAELDDVLRPGGTPSFDAVRRILATFGLQLVCRPATHV